MISLHVTLKNDATFGHAFRYGLQRSHRNHQFLAEMRAGLEGCRSFFDLRTRGRRDGIRWVSIYGGSSHGASLTEEEGLGWIQGVASELKLTAYVWFIHAGESERFDFHILAVNQFDGRKLRKMEITPLLHTAARNQTGLINAGRRATGRHTIGCCEADRTVVYPMAQPAPTPNPAPPPGEAPPTEPSRPAPLPDPADAPDAPKAGCESKPQVAPPKTGPIQNPPPAGPTAPGTAGAQAHEVKAGVNAEPKRSRDREAPERGPARPTTPPKHSERLPDGGGKTPAQVEAEKARNAEADADLAAKQRKKHEEQQRALMQRHRQLLLAASPLAKALAHRERTHAGSQTEDSLRHWQESVQALKQDLRRECAEPSLPPCMRQTYDDARGDIEETAFAIASLAVEFLKPSRDHTGPERD